MVKPSNSTTVSFALQNYNQADVRKSSPSDKIGPKSSGTQSFKGYVYIGHPPVLPDEIFGDPTNPQNIIDSKRTRKASTLNDSRSEKATHAVETKNYDKAKVSPEKPSIKLVSSAKIPATSCTEKGCAPKDASGYLTSKNHGNRKPWSYNEECDTISFQEEISPEDIRRGVLALVKRSLRIADDVSAYIRGIQGHSIQGQNLDRDVERVLDDRVERRERQSLKKGRAVKLRGL